MWIEPNLAGDPIWRGQITDVATGQQQGFGSLDALLTFLQNAGTTPASGKPGGRKR